MKIKKGISGLLGLNILMYGISGSANDDFQQWMQQQNQGVQAQKKNFRNIKISEIKNLRPF